MSGGAGPLPVLLAAIAGGIVVLAAREAVLSSPALAGWLRSAIAPLLRSRRAGHRASPGEVRRLALITTIALLIGSLWLTGPGPMTLLAAAGPGLASLALDRGRRRYREDVERGLPEVAIAIADALEGGRSVRAALVAAPASLRGPVAAELDRVRISIELGQSHQRALGELRLRIDGGEMASLVAALGSRLPGNDLAGVLRRFAASAAERRRVAADARTATAQARFTGIIVAAMPVGGGMIAELIQPGFTSRLLGDPAASLMLTVALATQIAGFVTINRIVRGIA